MTPGVVEPEPTPEVKQETVWERATIRQKLNMAKSMLDRLKNSND